VDDEVRITWVPKQTYSKDKVVTRIPVLRGWYKGVTSPPDTLQVRAAFSENQVVLTDQFGNRHQLRRSDHDTWLERSGWFDRLVDRQ